MSEITRQELGHYMSADCFQFLRQYTEETAGRGIIIQAGKERGFSLSDNLKGLAPNDGEGIKKVLGSALGKEGTRLCKIEEIKLTNKGYRVTISESACSSGIKRATPNCTYTMGVLTGAMEYISKARFSPTETECVACGGANCVYELDIF